MITGRVGQTKDERVTVELLDGEQVLLKAYLNSEKTKIRIVLPELRSMGQTKIDDEHHFLEFDRDARTRK